jgi:hypothetical protein
MFNSKCEFVREVEASMLNDSSIRRDQYVGPTLRYGRVYCRDYTEWNEAEQGVGLEDHIKSCIATDLARMAVYSEVDEKLIALAKLFELTDEDITRARAELYSGCAIVNVPVDQFSG